MKDQSREPINEKELDALREIASIGAGHAATSLADLLSHRVTMSVPELRFMSIDHLIPFFGDPEKEVVGIVFQISGSIRGNVLYIIEKQLCQSLLRVMLARQITNFAEIDAMDQSALTEIGNIVVSSYISAMAEATNLDIRVSPPSLALDMIGAILNYPLQFFDTLGEQVLFIEDNFSNGDENVSCHFLIMLEPASLQIMTRQLGINHG